MLSVLAGIAAVVMAIGLLVGLGVLISKTKGWKNLLIPGVVLVILLGVLWIYSVVRSTPVTEEFVLKVGEEVPTVKVGPGTYHDLRANKPYQAVSVQPDGSRKIYNMPAGWETWTGTAPPGRLRLIGKEKGTIVKISSRK